MRASAFSIRATISLISQRRSVRAAAIGIHRPRVEGKTRKSPCFSTKERGRGISRYIELFPVIDCNHRTTSMLSAKHVGSATDQSSGHIFKLTHYLSLSRLQRLAPRQQPQPIPPAEAHRPNPGSVFSACRVKYSRYELHSCLTCSRKRAIDEIRRIGLRLERSDIEICAPQ